MGALRSVALLVVSALLSVGLAEGVLRWVAPQPAAWLNIYRRLPKLPMPTLLPDVERRIDTGELHWTILTDSDGLRVGADPAPKGRPLALALGDSFTFGQGVHYEETFVSLLERESRAWHWRNAGHGGHGPTQYRQLLEYLLEEGFEPEFLLVGIYLGNDYHDCVWDKDLPVSDGVAGSEPGLRGQLKRTLHLYRLLARVYHRLGIAPVSHAGTELYEQAAWQRPPLTKAEPIFRDELAKIAAIAEARGIPLLAVVIPTRLSVDAIAGRVDGVNGDFPVARTGETLDALGIRWVDATPALLPIEAAYFLHDGHLTPEGHAAVAARLAPEIDSPR